MLKSKIDVKMIPELEKAAAPISFSIIWKNAIKAGAPAENAVASIIYHPVNGYNFSIQGTEHTYNFDLKGELK